MKNLLQHLSDNPLLLVFLLISLMVLFVNLVYFNQQKNIYGSMFRFASLTRKFATGIAFAVFILVAMVLISPYKAPASDEIAIVIGNTNNSPTPKISKNISESLIDTMLRHKGADKLTLLDSIKLISAAGEPVVIDFENEKIVLEEIGQNNSNAKRSAGANIIQIEKLISTIPPKSSGADYLEGILEARDNIKEGSRIIVIGSGLSDSGYLDFSKNNLLNDEQARENKRKEVKDEYGSRYLESFTVEFYGLGDTAAPQEKLSNAQKNIVRDFYAQVIRGLGGDVIINTESLTGESVVTEYLVGTTDTGCGDIGLVFNEENLKFIGNQAKFINPEAAKGSLRAVFEIWGKNNSNIQRIDVEGYIAHYPGPETLSYDRAMLVKETLVEMGISADVVNAHGRGFGPHNSDEQNRFVKVTINRNQIQCEK